MATRSIIAAKISDGTYRSIYCHFDGYPENNGRLLLLHYTDQAVIDQMMALGDMSVLNETLATSVFYGRDRGEKRIEAKSGSTPQSVLERDSGQEYEYLWDGRRWLIDGAPLTRAMCGLPEEKPALIKPADYAAAFGLFRYLAGGAFA